MRLPEISLLSTVEKIILTAYHKPRKHAILASEICSRFAATLLLSPAAAIDLLFHCSLILPTVIYALGKSVYNREVDFILPWQHLQRIRNTIAPLLLGSIFGALHPFAGFVMSEPTDKHSVLSILSSNAKLNLHTPSSPLHSLEIIENIGKKHCYNEINGENKEIFSKEHIKILNTTRNLELSLEILQAQEFIHKVTNLNLMVVSKIRCFIQNSNLNNFNKNTMIRIVGLLIPILSTVDVAVTLFVQGLFLLIGTIRLISGGGPIYTELTTNPLLHLTFLIQNILKYVGNLFGTLVWFISPEKGLRTSFLMAGLFFELQFNILMLQIKGKMNVCKDNEKFVIPIIFENNDNPTLAVSSMHSTYLIVEKNNQSFNLYWVNRPQISYKNGMNMEEALAQIHSMLKERFPSMDVEKRKNLPIISQKPHLHEALKFADIPPQGSSTNCVVSNIFAMLEAVDRINTEGEEPTKFRYKVVRETLVKDYSFYKNDFFPFSKEMSSYSLNDSWNVILKHANDPI